MHDAQTPKFCFVSRIYKRYRHCLPRAGRAVCEHFFSGFHLHPDNRNIMGQKITQQWI